MALKPDPISNAIAKLRESDDGTPAAKERMRSAILGTHPQLIVAGARLAAQSNHVDLIDDLECAFDRLVDSGSKSDPGCRAKDAIVTALISLEHNDPDFYLRGLGIVQLEPALGGPEETAGPIRSLCALRLPTTALGTEAVLQALTPLLFDASPHVRQDTVRAIGSCSTWEATLLLETKLRGGDDVAAGVAGECMLELLHADAERYLPLIVQNLGGGHEIRFQTICALSECRNPLATQALIDSCDTAVDGSDLEERYLALGRSRHEVAREFLQDRFANGTQTERALATRALGQ
jgi:hypothetical protein